MAGAGGNGSPDGRFSTHVTTAREASSEPSISGQSSLPHHKPHRHALPSSKDERCRDKALKKLCDKASAHLILAGAKESGPSRDLLGPLVEHVLAGTPDQVSLRDCPVTIPTSGVVGPDFFGSTNTRHTESCGS